MILIGPEIGLSTPLQGFAGILVREPLSWPCSGGVNSYFPLHEAAGGTPEFETRIADAACWRRWSKKLFGARREKMTAVGFQKALEAAREHVLNAATTGVPDTKGLGKTLARPFPTASTPIIPPGLAPGVQHVQQGENRPPKQHPPPRITHHLLDLPLIAGW